MKQLVRPVILPAKEAIKDGGHFWRTGRPKSSHLGTATENDADILSMTCGGEDLGKPHTTLSKPCQLCLIEDRQPRKGEWMVGDSKIYFNDDQLDGYIGLHPVVAISGYVGLTNEFAEPLKTVPLIHPDFVKLFVEKQGKVGKCFVEMESMCSNGHRRDYTNLMECRVMGCHSRLFDTPKLINGYVIVEEFFERRDFLKDLVPALELIRRCNDAEKKDVVKEFEVLTGQVVPAQAVKIFELTGLNNVDFLTSDYLNEYGIKNLLQYLLQFQTQLDEKEKD